MSGHGRGNAQSVFVRRHHHVPLLALAFVDWVWPQLSLTELAFIRTKHPVREAAAHFWTKIHVVNFGQDVATGIVVGFEFGTNRASKLLAFRWRYSRCRIGRRRDLLLLLLLDFWRAV